MLFTSKNKSDVNLKGQRMQRFLRENINHAKTRQVRVNSKSFAKFDTREGTPVIPRHARWQAVSTENDWVWESKWHKCNKTYILIKATKQSIIKNKQTTEQIVTLKINSSLWNRVIAWERSRAASSYGIIWGDADRKQTRRNLVRNIIAWIVVVTARF